MGQPGTGGQEQAAEEARNRLAQNEIQPPSSFRRRPACMDAGGRAASGTKAEESSGLYKPFPQGGNDRRMTPADRGKSQFVSHPASAPLDSSLRWNDNGGEYGKIAEEQKAPSFIDTPTGMQVVGRRLKQAAEEARNRLAQIEIQLRRHSGAGRNPVVYTIHARNAGMASEEYLPLKTPTQSQAAPAPPRPPRCHNPLPHPR